MTHEEEYDSKRMVNMNLDIDCLRRLNQALDPATTAMIVNVWLCYCNPS